MGQRYTELSEKQIQFIANQHIYFVGTAAADGRVNVSPKGMDTVRVLSSSRVVWLNVTGSGNETSAHVQCDPRMTMMWCAFDGPPLILRVYGAANVLHRTDPEWDALISLFPPLPGPRQLFDLRIDLVQTSCGMSIPSYTYAGDRDLLNAWAEKKGEDGIRHYWEEKNQVSLDGKPTNILAKNG